MANKTDKATPWTSRIILHGLQPGIMFDKYAGDNKTQLADHEKMPLMADGTVYLPAMNLSSFYSAENTPSVCQRLLDKRIYKDKARALLAFLRFSPAEIPLTRNGKPVRWEGTFDDSVTSGPSGIVLHRSVARLPKGIPNPKSRPLVLAPWDAEFEMTLYPNEWVDPKELISLTERGMGLIGLGTYRGVFGRSTVEWK